MSSPYQIFPPPIRKTKKRRIYPSHNFPTLESIPDLQDILLTLSPDDYPISTAARILFCPILYERVYNAFTGPEYRLLPTYGLSGDIKDEIKFLFLSFLATAPADYLLAFLEDISSPNLHTVRNKKVTP